jgi:acetyl-CoA carboxylase biotin carboxylase subunit
MRTALLERVRASTPTSAAPGLMVDAKFMDGGTNIHYLEEWLSHHKR